MYENIASHASTSESEEAKKKIQVDKRTKAEIAFEKSKEKKVYQNSQVQFIIQHIENRKSFTEVLPYYLSHIIWNDVKTLKNSLL